MLSRRQTWLEIRVAVMAIFVFAFGVLLASAIHRDLFSFTSLATGLWFGCFLVATITLGLLTARAIWIGGSRL
jgi:hypothetical protein